MKKYVLLFIALSCLASPSLAVDYDITSFGAKAKGKVLNTQVIQAAVDRCSADGGGRVVVPRGEFLTGTIELKDGVILYLDFGAKLQGSTKKQDYTKNLIRGVGVRNIGITGPGTIDGAGWAFWYVKEDGHYDHDRPVPGNMIYLEDCHDIRIEGVRLQNAESWTVHLLGCSKAVIRGITIRNPLHGPNNDGIDLQATRDVMISDCDIYTSDDAIVLKNRTSQYAHLPCANITVTNCILTSVCNAFKIGTETIGAFRNIVFSNSTIRCALPEDSLARVRYNDVKMPVRAISGISIESVDGSVVDGVAITNITMEDVRVPIFIRLANRGAGTQRVQPSQPGEVKNIIISNVTATHAWYASSITAIPGSYVENVILDNIIIRMAGGGDEKLAEKIVDEKIKDYPDAHMWRELPASGLYVRHVKGFDMKTVRINLDGEDKRPVLIFDDVKQLNVSNFKTDANPTGEAAIRLAGVEDAKFSDLYLSPLVRYDIDIRGTDSKKICVVEGEQKRVKTTLTINKGVVNVLEIP